MSQPSNSPDSIIALTRDFKADLVHWGLEVIRGWHGTPGRLTETIAAGAGWDQPKAQRFIDRVAALPK